MGPNGKINKGGAKIAVLASLLAEERWSKTKFSLYMSLPSYTQSTAGELSYTTR